MTIYWKGIPINLPSYKNGQQIFIKILDPISISKKVAVELIAIYSPFWLNQDAYYWTNDEITKENGSIYEMINSMVWLLPIGQLEKEALIQVLNKKALIESKGLCHGIAGTSVLYKNGDLPKPIFSAVYTWNKTIALPDIRRIWWEQFELSEDNLFQNEYDFLNSTKYYLSGGQGGFAKCVTVLCQWENPNASTSSPKIFRHTVAAYKLIELKNSSGEFMKAKVYIYDSNKPFSRDDILFPLISPALIEVTNDNGNIKFEEGLKFDDRYIYDTYSNFGIHYPNNYSQQEINNVIVNFWYEYLHNLFTLGRYFISFACPVEPIITDNYGKKIGIENGIIINEITEAEIDTVDDMKLFHLPTQYNYNIKVTATSNGSFDHYILSPIKESSTEIISFEDVSLNQNGTATLNLTANNPNYTMYIDADGDGKIDSTRQPDQHTYTGGLTVWPGDTNNDGIVNQADILPLGLYWEKTGPARTCHSNENQWIAHTATPWDPEAATYADANGDGKINQADLLTIGLNWEKTHTLLKLLTNYQSATGNVSGSLIPVLGYNCEDKEAYLEIYVNEITNLFGLAFEINYPHNELDVISVEKGNLFNPNALFYYNEKSELGKIGIGISQKLGQKPISDNGIVAKIFFKQKIGVTSINKDAIQIDNLQANDANGKPLLIISRAFENLDLLKELASTQSSEFKLFANYPNPFNPTTTISYSIPKSVHVCLQIFDLNGRLVKTLFNAQQAIGVHSMQWDAIDENDNRVASGIYICLLNVGNVVLHKKLILTK